MLFLILLRRAADFPLKHIDEMGRRCVPQLYSNLLDVVPAFLQQEAGLLHLQVCDVVREGGSGDGAE